MIKFIYQTEAEIPAALKANYAQDASGAWVLQVEGAVAKSVVDSFRENNITLTKEVDSLKAKFKDVDPVEYTSLKGRAAELEEGKLIKKEGLDAAVEARVKKMREDYDKQLAETSAKLTNATAEMGKLKIDTALVTEASKLGLRPEATRDFVYRGREIFRLDEEGNVVAMEADGKTKRFGASGSVLSIPEFVQTAAKDKEFAHLFNPSSGGGAAGGGGKGQGGVNPFAKGKENLTQQAQLLSSNPTLYNQLKNEAAAAN